MNLLYLSSWRKRALDLCVAIPALVTTLPILLVGVAATWMSVGRPVLFRHERAGRDGRPFVVLKLRTMRDPLDPSREESDAERLTRIGNIVRKLSIDELPQIWNVVRGEMSIVGPRPLLLRYVPRYNQEQRLRLAAKPGLTGLAVVRGRNTITWEEKFALDIEYVRTASLAKDLRILLATIPTLVRVRRTSAEGHATMPEFMGNEGD